MGLGQVLALLLTPCVNLSKHLLLFKLLKQGNRGLYRLSQAANETRYVVHLLSTKHL